MKPTRDTVYNRAAAVEYARRWALGRNPDYYDFNGIGGDCTNFASQCLFAGSKIMNYTAVTGWYYHSSYDRTASWTGVEYLYRFLIGNRSLGPYGRLVAANEIKPGDIVQLGSESKGFYHSPVVTAVLPTVLVSAHTFDALDLPLSSYSYEKLRFIHIDGVRVP